MLTRFGKTLRKIRIEHDELLKDMANKLNVTVAYLSAVENGKRDVPDGWVEIISEKYGLSSLEQRDLQEHAYENKHAIKICIDNIDDEEKNLALAFARSFKTLTEEEMQIMYNILNR